MARMILNHHGWKLTWNLLRRRVIGGRKNQVISATTEIHYGHILSPTSSLMNEMDSQMSEGIINGGDWNNCAPRSFRIVLAVHLAGRDEMEADALHSRHGLTWV